MGAFLHLLVEILAGSVITTFPIFRTSALNTILSHISHKATSSDNTFTIITRGTKQQTIAPCQGLPQRYDPPD